MAAWAIRVKSCASWTLPEQNRPKPVLRTAMTSEWSPKMESAWLATSLAETWNTVGVSSPAILNILGIISSSPCEAVKVVHSAPLVKAPWTAPLAPPSDCISLTEGTVPQIFLSPLADLASDTSPIPEEGVIG